MNGHLRLPLLASCAFVLLNVICEAQTFNQKVYPSTLGAAVINRGDFNKDGILDVITGNYGPTGLTVYFGNPDGTLRPGISSPAPTAYDIGLGDFNHDGEIDVAVLSYGPTGTGDEVQIMLGNGDGTFRLGQLLNIPPSTNPASSLTVADFNGDGLLDLAVGGDTIYFYAGKGDGTFSPTVTEPPGAQNWVRLVRVGDFDGDGRPDVALTDGFSIWVLFNNGNFNFTPVQVRSFTLAELNGEITFTPQDVNQDGNTDLIFSYDPCPQPPNPDKGINPGCPSWVVLLSDGASRSFHQSGSFTGDTSYATFYALKAADIDGDGIKDIVAVATNFGIWEVAAWLGNPDGSYSNTPLTFPTGSSGTADLVVGDFNRDGRPDLAIVNVSISSMATMLNALPQANCNHTVEVRSVTICKPLDETYTNSPVHVVAQATDDTEVIATQVYVDNAFVSQLPGPAFDQQLPLPLGDHFLVVSARDTDLRTYLAGTHVTVYSGTPGETCPAAQNSANICLPAAGAMGGTSVHVLAAAQASRTITAMQVYVDGQLMYNDTSLSTYVDTSLTVVPGQHQILVKAWDDSGGTYTSAHDFTAQ